MNIKKYHTVGKVSKSNSNIVEGRKANWITLTQSPIVTSWKVERQTGYP
jgi:hypothetical protein